MQKFSRTEDITERARDLREDVSKTESKLWPILCRGRMGASFRRQHPIGPFFADYCCPALKLVIEIDGPFHSAAEDAARDKFMVARGYNVLRFSVEDMDRRFKNVIEAIHIQVQLSLQERESRDKQTSPSKRR